MSESSRTFAKALYGLDATVGRVAASQWGNRSPCERWNAAEVVDHCVELHVMVIQSLGGAEPQAAKSQPERWRTTFASLLTTLDQPGALAALIETPWESMPLDDFLSFAWIDPLLHTWDVAMATGQTPILDAELVDRALRQLVGAGAALRGPGQFGPAVELSGSATSLEKLVAISGRDPHWA